MDAIKFIQPSNSPPYSSFRQPKNLFSLIVFQLSLWEQLKHQMSQFIVH